MSEDKVETPTEYAAPASTGSNADGHIGGATLSFAEVKALQRRHASKSQFTRADIEAMKKADLVGLLAEKGADAGGSVAELRARLSALLFGEAATDAV